MSHQEIFKRKQDTKEPGIFMFIQREKSSMEGEQKQELLGNLQ